jgi:hypothetical protein
MTRLSLVAAAALLAAAFTSSCKSACLSTGPDCTDTPPAASSSRFSISMARAPSSLGAMMIEVRSPKPFQLQFTGTARLSQLVSMNTEQSIWRAIIVGGPKSGALATVVVSVGNADMPTASVIDAAADESGQFQPLSSTQVAVSVARAN